MCFCAYLSFTKVPFEASQFNLWPSWEHKFNFLPFLVISLFPFQQHAVSGFTSLAYQHAVNKF